jgi:imidazolonepropionase-like amidohydrolase
VIRAGGYGAIGEHGEQIGIGSHWEIWGYASALTPLEALRMATWSGAYFVGLQNQIGSIAPGKLADLVVLNSDPMVDIKNTADIQFVMKHGILYDDETLDQIWPIKGEYGKPPWK